MSCPFPIFNPSTQLNRMEEPKCFYTVVDVLGKLASLPAFCVCARISGKVQGKLDPDILEQGRNAELERLTLVEFLSLHRDEGKASLFMTKVSSFDPGCEKRITFGWGSIAFVSCSGILFNL